MNFKRIFILIFFSLVAKTAFTQCSGTGNPCVGSTYSYTYSGSSTKVSWTVSNGGTINGSPLLKTISVTWNQTGGPYTVYCQDLINGNDCSVSVTVLAPAVGGSVSTNASNVCPGGSATLTLSGQSGTIVRWETSTDGVNWTSINNGGIATYNATNLQATTSFRAVLSMCGNQPTSSPATVAVYSGITSAGSISGSSTICYGSLPASLQETAAPASSGGTSFQWQSRINSGAWTDISGATSSTYSPGALYQTTDFQRLVKWNCNSAQTAASNILTVTVNSATTIGTLGASPTSVCSSGSVSVSASSLVSTSTQWQYRYSDTGGASYSGWSNFSTANTSPQTLAVSSTNVDRIYQVQVIAQNGVCSPVTSTPSSITVNSNYTGTLSTSLIEAYGVSTSSFSIGGYAGTFQKWQQSTNGGAIWTDADGVNTSTTYQYTNVTTSTQYRALITSGTCSTYSAVMTLSIYIAPSIQMVGTSVPVIALGNTITFQSGTTYYSYQWIKNGTDIAGATSSSYMAAEPAQYQLRVKANASAPLTTTGNFVIYALGYQADINNNAVITTTIRKAGVTSATNLFTSLQAKDYTQQITYSDYLGRPTQSIALGLSPLQHDIVQPVVYDTLKLISYLPYVSSARDGLKKTNALAGGNGTYATSEQYSFYNQSPSSKIAVDNAPYAQALVENSPTNRVIESGAPGSDFQPGTHTTKPEFHTNSASDIRMWTISGPTGYYAANVLSVVKSTDENGHVVMAYADNLGRAILKRVQIDATIEGTAVTYLETYYVYDTQGNLALQVPPKAVQKLNTGTAWSTTFRDTWCFVYTYDGFSRVVTKQSPGTAVQYIAYDSLGRVVLTQDGNLRTLNKWAFVKYDYKGRAVMSGLYTNNSSLTTVQTLLNGLYTNPNTAYYEQRATNNNFHGYTNQSFPTQNADASAIEVLNVSYYDNYDFDNNGTADYSYVAQGITGEGAQGNSFELPTGSKKLILNTTTWLYTYQFYDRFGRVIQSRSNNHLSSAIDNLTTIIYDFEGKVLQTKTYHNAGGTNQYTVIKKNCYDNAGRLQKVYQNINGEANDLLVAQYNYNELGQVVEKNLHLLYDAQDGQTGVITADDLVKTEYTNENQLVARNSIKLLPNYSVKASSTPFVMRLTTVTQAQAEANGRYLQSVDYRYNIQGRITSINNAQLANDGSTNDDANDYFGMELLYNTQDAGLANTANYNGNISAVKWKNGGVAAGAADQRSFVYGYDKSDKLLTTSFKAHNGTAWAKEAGTLNESLGYDANGNILSLARSQNQRGLSGTTVTSAPQTIDNLTYTYATSNQLSKVEDSGISAGFNNGATNTTEYTYDTNGSLTKDDNKGISAITYNALGKAQSITFTDGRSVTYKYDAGGNKLSMTSVNGTTTTTDYVGGFVYNNNALGFFSSPEGRVVKNGSNYEYQYAISDHQGNTRIVFTSATPAAQAVTATFETANQTTEATQFSNYGHISATANHTAGGTNSQYLNGGYAGMVGVAKSYKVYPGDQLKIEAYGSYNAPSGSSSSLASFAGALLTAFALPTPVAGETGTAASGVNTWGGIEASGFGDGTNDQTDPKAFVNIVIFDKNYKFLDVAYAQLKGTSLYYLSQTYTVKEAGYAYLYVSNEQANQTDVYFDDVKMTYTPSNIIQSNEYYTHSMPTANSWTRDNSTNNFLGNGGTELNTTSSLYDLQYRNYDAVLGRFHQVDPMVDQFASHSPYNFAFNNPVLLNDPNGANPFGVAAQNTGWEIWFSPDAWKLGIGQGGGGTRQSTLDRWAATEQDAQMKKDAEAVRNQKMSPEEYAEKYGEKVSGSEGAHFGYNINGVFGIWRNNVTIDSWVDKKIVSTFTSSFTSLSELFAQSSASGSTNDPLNAIGQIVFDGGATTYGASALAISRFRKVNGGQILNRAIGFGTSHQANTLLKLANTTSKVGTVAGVFGYGIQVVSIGSKLYNGEQISTADGVGFGVSTVLVGAGAILAGTAGAPFVAGAALIYGVGELGSLLFTGETLETNFFGK